LIRFCATGVFLHLINIRAFMVSKADNANTIKGNSGDRNLGLLDERGFRRLFHENYAALCKYSLRLVRRPEMAEEIVQEQFIYIWNNRNRILVHTSYQSYLYKSVRNKSIDYLRSRFAKAEFVDDTDFVFQSAMEDPSAAMESDELKQLIGKAVFQLPEKCHTIFSMSRFGEMKNQEIADTLNISIKTVENQITIALRKIKSFLEKHWMMLAVLFSLILERE
jgi:RNA polymerase sigma-70 factor, ECF subfamily